MTSDVFEPSLTYLPCPVTSNFGGCFDPLIYPKIGLIYGRSLGNRYVCNFFCISCSRTYFPRKEILCEIQPFNYFFQSIIKNLYSWYCWQRGVSLAQPSPDLDYFGLEIDYWLATIYVFDITAVIRIIKWMSLGYPNIRVFSLLQVTAHRLLSYTNTCVFLILQHS